jgi:hypothetical protein
MVGDPGPVLVTQGALQVADEGLFGRKLILRGACRERERARSACRNQTQCSPPRNSHLVPVICAISQRNKSLIVGF